MTGSFASQGHRVRTRGAASICKSAVALAALGLAAAGCAGGRSGDLAPRTPDASAPPSEAPAPRSESQAPRSEARPVPQGPEPSYRVALQHYGRHEVEPALAALHEALRGNPSYVPALTLLARVLHDTGHSAEGVRYFKARPLGEWPEPVRLDLALLYADTGNTVQARRILAGLANGTYADAARANLAYLDLVDEANASSLVPGLERLASGQSDSPEVLNNLAVARLRAGDVEGSARLLQQLVSRWPDFAPAQMNLALVLRNYIFDDQGASRAQHHFEELAEPAVGDAALRELLGVPRTEDTAPAASSTAPAPRSTTPEGKR